MILGCMRLGGTDESAQNRAFAAFDAALETGIRMFDHADIYGDGQPERHFGEWLRQRPGVRERITVQTKCGIRPGMYDFSPEHIEAAVAGSLERLGIETIDMLLLHRPDPLMEPKQVGSCLNALHEAGLVKAFGVSNMNAAQMGLLQNFLSTPLRVNQLELSLGKLDWLNEGVHVNQAAGRNVHFADGVIEHCQLNDVQMQAWAPLAYGWFSGRPPDHPHPSWHETARQVEEMAAAKGTSREAIVLGWLMRHPAAIQAVIGTTHPDRIRACGPTAEVAATMTRDEWYSLFIAARGEALP